MSTRAYPLPRPESGNDPRFTFGLTNDLGNVLERHGFPPVRGVDHVELGLALFRFIYAAEEEPTPSSAAAEPEAADLTESTITEPPGDAP